MHIRLAQINDIPAIVSLGRQLLEMHKNFDPPYYTLEESFDETFGNWVKMQLNSQNQFILVADCEDGTISGFISGFLKSLYPWFCVKSVGHIAYLIIHPSYRTKGIGKSLESEAIHWFLEKKVKYVEVYADEINTIGLHAWKSYGYSDFKKFFRKEI